MERDLSLGEASRTFGFVEKTDKLSLGFPMDLGVGFNEREEEKKDDETKRERGAEITERVSDSDFRSLTPIRILPPSCKSGNSEASGSSAAPSLPPSEDEQDGDNRRVSSYSGDEDDGEDDRQFSPSTDESDGNSEASGSSASHLESSADEYDDEDDRQFSSSADERAGENLTSDYIKYLPLYKATLKGDWTTAKNFLDNVPGAETARITHHLETAMHVAVRSRNNVDFVKELLEYMTAKKLVLRDKNGNTSLSLAKELELRDKNGNTSLSLAAIAANTKAAEMLVRKNSNLPQKRNNLKKTPLLKSAERGHKEMTQYLLSVTRDEDEDEDEDPSPFRGKSGILLLNSVIIAGFYDVALKLVQDYPSLATTKERGVDTPLYTLSRMRSAFPSGTQPSFWQRLIYKCVPIKLDNEPLFPIRSDTENPTQSSRGSMQMSNWLRFVKGIQISSGS